MPSAFRSCALVAVLASGCVSFPSARLELDPGLHEQVSAPIVCGPMGFRRTPLQSRWGEFVRVTVASANALEGTALVHANGIAGETRSWSTVDGALVIEARFENADPDARFALHREQPIDVTVSKLAALTGTCEGAVFTVEQGELVPNIDEHAWMVELERRGGPELAARREARLVEMESIRQAHYAAWEAERARAQVDVAALAAADAIRQAHYSAWEERRRPEFAAVTSPEEWAVAGGSNSGGTSSAVNGTISSSVSGGAISGGAMSGGAMSGGAMSGGAMSGGAMSGGAMSGGAMSGGAMTGGAITGGAMTGGAMSGGAMTGGAMTGGAMTGGAMSGGAMSGGAMSGGAMTGGAMTGGAMSVGTISGGAISGGAVSGGAMSGGAMTGGAISGGAISGGTMSAGNIYGGAFTGRDATGHVTATDDRLTGLNASGETMAVTLCGTSSALSMEAGPGGQPRCQGQPQPATFANAQARGAVSSACAACERAHVVDRSVSAHASVVTVAADEWSLPPAPTLIASEPTQWERVQVGPPPMPAPVIVTSAPSPVAPSPDPVAGDESEEVEFILPALLNAALNVTFSAAPAPPPRAPDVKVAVPLGSR